MDSVREVSVRECKDWVTAVHKQAFYHGARGGCSVVQGRREGPDGCMPQVLIGAEVYNSCEGLFVLPDSGNRQ